MKFARQAAEHLYILNIAAAVICFVAAAVNLSRGQYTWAAVDLAAGALNSFVLWLVWTRWRLMKEVRSFMAHAEEDMAEMDRFLTSQINATLNQRNSKR